MEKMEKIFADYIELKLELERMLGEGEIPGQEILQEIRELESYIREQGYDPDVIFLNHKGQRVSSPTVIDTEKLRNKNIVSRIIRYVKPVFPTDEGYVKSAEAYVETEHGTDLHITESDVMCWNGEPLEENDKPHKCMYPGCSKWVCRKHFWRCFDCGIGVCTQHAPKLELDSEPGREVRFCPDCHERRIRHFNTWEYRRKAMILRDRIALPKLTEDEL